MPRSAEASGRPVIAYDGGGATETILENQTGVFFKKQNWESLLDAILKFNHANWDSAVISEHAKKFDVKIFQEKMQRAVNDYWDDFQNKMNQATLIR